ncbi:MAG: CocE/NonD family hydrolase, partial [Ectothiorhodospiraceae bacterium]
VEVIRWLAEQPWCSGSVGMIGISWGGFNGLQIAALQPEPLKAIVSVCSTDDRYADDVHYMGGCLLSDNLSWASVMFAFNSLPPDPEIVGDAWREMWFRRLDASEPWLETWLRHQRRDAYWRHGSVCEDFSAVHCPVMAVSGWADGYSNSVFRLLASLEVPRKGLVGPWSHKYPHMGEPGPAVGFLQECLRWWDRWLKGEPNGVEKEPMLLAWMQHSVPPHPSYDVRPGHWVAEAEWPSAGVRERGFALAQNVLVPEEEKAAEQALTVQSPLSLGLFAGKWCSYAATPDLPHDQREEDGGALVFDSPPLDEALEILGAPFLDLEVEANRPVAMIAARLSDVAPDDKTTRITYGLLNLTHRDGHADPEPLIPGRRYRVRLQLNDVGQRFPRGHRLRIALSTSYWPLAWAPPEPVRLTVHTGGSRLVLPERPPRTEDAETAPFGPAEGAAPISVEQLGTTEHNWWVLRDLARDESTLQVVKDEGRERIAEIDLQLRDKVLEWYSFRGDDFTSLRGEVESVRGFIRGDWSVETRTRTVLTADTDNFYIRAELDAWENDVRVFSRNWDLTVPRDHL